MSDFFERKKVKKSPHDKWNLDSKSDLEACGLRKEESASFSERSNSFFKSLEKAANMQLDINPVAYCAKQAEEHFSHREMAFLLAKTILVEALKEQAETNKKK